MYPSQANNRLTNGDCCGAVQLPRMLGDICVERLIQNTEINFQWPNIVQRPSGLSQVTK